MHPLLRTPPRWAAGSTVIGAAVGLSEALYRDVPVVYAMALYAALWALAGCALGAVAGAVGLARRSITTGATLAGASSALVLTHFVLWRDIFVEAPGKNGVAWAAGLGSALLVGGLVWATFSRLEPLLGDADGPWFAVPVTAWLGLAAFAMAPPPAAPPADSPPAHTSNASGVILIVADALRADALGVYGAPPHRDTPATPHIDALAESAQVFTQASAQASWTKPAVASLLTSRSVPGHNTMAKTAVLPTQLPTLASELTRHGVHTGAVVTNYNLESAFGFDRGFDAFTYLAPSRYLGAPEAANRLAAYNVYRLVRERFFKHGRRSEYFYQDAATVNHHAMAFLDHHPEGPFFLWLHYMEAHDPYFDVDGLTSWARVSDPHPNPDAAPAMAQAYRDGVRRLDSGVGELLTALARRGLDERTTVILTADHGEELGEHGGFYHGTSLYEELLHIPLIIKGLQVAPSTQEGLARQIDVAPTVLHHFGIAPPTSWEGITLLQAAPGDITWADEDHEGNVLHAVRVDDGNTRLKTIHANADNPRGLPTDALFDLQQDPHEQHPLPTTDPRLAGLHLRLAAAQDPNRPVAPAISRPLDSASQAELRSLGYVQ